MRRKTITATLFPWTPIMDWALNAWPKNELAKLLMELKIPATGTKRDLIDRLIENAPRWADDVEITFIKPK